MSPGPNPPARSDQNISCRRSVLTDGAASFVAVLSSSPRVLHFARVAVAATGRKALRRQRAWICVTGGGRQNGTPRVAFERIHRTGRSALALVLRRAHRLDHRDSNCFDVNLISKRRRALLAQALSSGVRGKLLNLARSAASRRGATRSSPVSVSRFHCRHRTQQPMPGHAIPRPYGAPGARRRSGPSFQTTSMARP